MKKFQLQHFLAKLTMFFTVTTALLILTMVWFFPGKDNTIVSQFFGTSIAFAAFSFVSFLVATFYKE
ncbi:MAG: hypothetical protein PHO48_01725 [Candidatus Gracilibacteria bacterium]|nr:hypothetical protein [Candidatus Gracilibacteria bacterium]MDD5178930.1 hypothetical protein [Candidatus Gracilibacteria bacterium]